MRTRLGGRALPCQARPRPYNPALSASPSWSSREPNMSDEKPVVGIIMGSRSDWPTLKFAAAVLDALKVPYETKVVSAHRTPKRLYDYAATARERGLQVIIAGAGDDASQAPLAGGRGVGVAAL